jgi:hypothetical protein
MEMTGKNNAKNNRLAAEPLPSYFPVKLVFLADFLNGEAFFNNRKRG